MKSYIKEINQLIAEENEADAITLLEKYCGKNPSDLGAKFDLALLLAQQTTYVDGFFDSMKILDDILIKSPRDIKLIILKAYIEYEKTGQISNNSLSQLNSYASITTNYNFLEKQIWILKAFSYQDISKELYLDSLKKSIEFDGEASFNYYLIAKEYIDKKDYLTAKIYLERSKRNIIKVYSQKDLNYFDIFDFEEYVNEHLRGVYITEPNYESIINDLKLCGAAQR